MTSLKIKDHITIQHETLWNRLFIEVKLNSMLSAIGRATIFYLYIVMNIPACVICLKIYVQFNFNGVRSTRSISLFTITSIRYALKCGFHSSHFHRNFCTCDCSILAIFRNRLTRFAGAYSKSRNGNPTLAWLTGKI